MTRLTSWRQRRRTSLSLAVVALRSWGPRQFAAAIIAAAVVAAIIGIATVLIPNPVFARDIPPVWWDYPVWLLSSAMMGMLIATYVRPLQDPGASRDYARSGTDSVTTEGAADRSEKGGARAAGVLAWFAVGCPVCNKIALLALGYTGALTWFAPFQPVLAVTALILATFALVWRLKGQLACPLPAPAGSAEPISR